MATQAAERLKKEFADMPAEYFEPLTFGELKIGEAFISYSRRQQWTWSI